jgi:hypothetical protein
VIDVSPWRLNLLRAVYALIAFAMGAMTWPKIIMQTGDWALMPGVVKCMLGAFTLLCLLGLRYPLKMLPVLFWELIWKSIWLLAVALPAWQAGAMDAETAENAFATGLVILVYAVIPWDYVWAHYIRMPGDPFSINRIKGEVL